MYHIVNTLSEDPSTIMIEGNRSGWLAEQSMDLITVATGALLGALNRQNLGKDPSVWSLRFNVNLVAQSLSPLHVHTTGKRIWCHGCLIAFYLLEYLVKGDYKFKYNGGRVSWEH